MGKIKTIAKKALKAAASMIKSQKTQSKGPAGKVMKKKRGGSIKK